MALTQAFFHAVFSGDIIFQVIFDEVWQGDQKAALFYSLLTDFLDINPAAFMLSRVKILPHRLNQQIGFQLRIRFRPIKALADVIKNSHLKSPYSVSGKFEWLMGGTGGRHITCKYLFRDAETKSRLAAGNHSP